MAWCFYLPNIKYVVINTMYYRKEYYKMLTTNPYVVIIFLAPV